MDNNIELKPTPSGVVVTKRGEVVYRLPLPPKSELIDLYHALWLEIHAKQDPTPEWFADWCKRVPKTCGCDIWLKAYLEKNPPRYDDWFVFSVELHNAVAAKLDREQWTLARAREYYIR